MHVMAAAALGCLQGGVHDHRVEHAVQEQVKQQQQQQQRQRQQQQRALAKQELAGPPKAKWQSQQQSAKSITPVATLDGSLSPSGSSPSTAASLSALSFSSDVTTSAAASYSSSAASSIPTCTPSSATMTTTTTTSSTSPTSSSSPSSSAPLGALAPGTMSSSPFSRHVRKTSSECADGSEHQMHENDAPSSQVGDNGGHSRSGSSDSGGSQGGSGSFRVVRNAACASASMSGMSPTLGTASPGGIFKRKSLSLDPSEAKAMLGGTMGGGERRGERSGSYVGTSSPLSCSDNANTSAKRRQLAVNANE